VPEYLVPKTGGENGSSFQYRNFSGFGVQVGSNYETQIQNALIVGTTYTAADIWRILFGLLPGDQLTFPQIAGREIAQALYEGEDETSPIADKTLVTTFCAPRMVLKTEMPSTQITITAESTAEQVAAILRGGIDADASFTTIVDQFFSAFDLNEFDNDNMSLTIADSYDGVFGIGSYIRALGVILSRYDSEHKKWLYSTSNLVCVWDFLAQNSGEDYFGFTVDNAIATYRATVLANANGNFLQRGGTHDIVPASFR
jgi:hypothetical protein